MWLTLLLSCTSPPLPAATPRWDLEGDDLFDAPWPADTRIQPDGTIDITGFPGAKDVPLLGLYTSLIPEETGYGTNTPVFLSFDEPIDVDLLPSPEDGLDGSVFLVDVDPSSPEWGQAIPLRVAFSEERTTFKPPNLLAAAPVWGRPLRPSTTYAFVVTTELARPAPGFASVWRTESPVYSTYEPLATALPFLGMERADVAVATVFTTTDPTRRMAKHARLIQEHLTPPPLTQTLAYDEALSNEHFDFYEGTMKAPLWQHGARPYATTGGAFAYDETGRPEVAAWDDMRLAVCTPKDLSSPPPGGWPVVLYRHGTGGDFRSFCRGSDDLTVARWLAESGFIGIGTDEPLHGIRATPNTNPELHWFNYLNPTAGRTNFLQSALDIVYLAKTFGGQEVELTTSRGEALPLDPERVYLMAHSQGGLAGAIALPWLGEHLDGAVLSGAGGGLSITIIERKDPIDIAAQVGAVLRFDDGESLDEFHPVTALIQWLTESTDPINFAPYWMANEAPWASQHPIPVLVTSGEADHATPNRSASAMAAAAGIPQLSPTFSQPEAFALRGLEPVEGAQHNNVLAYDGTETTAAFLQYADASHWVVFESRTARDTVRDFLISASEGSATIER